MAAAPVTGAQRHSSFRGLASGSANGASKRRANGHGPRHPLADRSVPQFIGPLQPHAPRRPVQATPGSPKATSTGTTHQGVGAGADAAPLPRVPSSFGMGPAATMGPPPSGYPSPSPTLTASRTGNGTGHHRQRPSTTPHDRKAQEPRRTYVDDIMRTALHGSASPGPQRSSFHEAPERATSWDGGDRPHPVTRRPSTGLQRGGNSSGNRRHGTGPLRRSGSSSSRRDAGADASAAAGPRVDSTVRALRRAATGSGPEWSIGASYDDLYSVEAHNARERAGVPAQYASDSGTTSMLDQVESSKPSLGFGRVSATGYDDRAKVTQIGGFDMNRDRLLTETQGPGSSFPVTKIDNDGYLVYYPYAHPADNPAVSTPGLGRAPSFRFGGPVHVERDGRLQLEPSSASGASPIAGPGRYAAPSSLGAQARAGKVSHTGSRSLGGYDARRIGAEPDVGGYSAYAGRDVTVPPPGAYEASAPGRASKSTAAAAAGVAAPASATASGGGHANTRTIGYGANRRVIAKSSNSGAAADALYVTVPSRRGRGGMTSLTKGSGAHSRQLGLGLGVGLGKGVGMGPSVRTRTAVSSHAANAASLGASYTSFGSGMVRRLTSGVSTAAANDSGSRGLGVRAQADEVAATIAASAVNRTDPRQWETLVTLRLGKGWSRLPRAVRRRRRPPEGTDFDRAAREWAVAVAPQLAKADAVARQEQSVRRRNHDYEHGIGVDDGADAETRASARAVVRGPHGFAMAPLPAEELVQRQTPVEWRGARSAAGPDHAHVLRSDIFSSLEEMAMEDTRNSGPPRHIQSHGGVHLPHHRPSHVEIEGLAGGPWL